MDAVHDPVKMDGSARLSNSINRRFFAFSAFISALALLVGLWARVIWILYADRGGLFRTIAADWAAYFAQAAALADGKLTILYDGAALAPYRQILASYSSNPNLPLYPSVVPYLPLFAWAFSPLTHIPPPIGFALWTVLNAVAAVWLAARVAGLFAKPIRPWVVLILLGSFPIMRQFISGEIGIWTACVMAEVYLSLRSGRDLRAGLWLGSLVLKPHLAILLGPILLWKRRWAAVAGAAITSVGILVGSVLVAGVPPLLTYPSAVAELGGIRGIAATAPEVMVNWRALVLLVRPEISDRLGIALVVLLGALMVLCVVPAFLGRWRPTEPIFAIQMALVMVATLVVGYHSHANYLILLAVPFAAVLAGGSASRLTRFAIILFATVPTLTALIGSFLPPIGFAGKTWLGVALPYPPLYPLLLLACFAGLMRDAWRLQRADVRRVWATARTPAYAMLPWLLLLAGVGAIGLSIVADLLGIGTGFGTKRAVLAAIGSGCVLAAFVLRQSARGRQQLPPGSRSAEPPSILAIALMFGLLTGIGELLFYVYSEVRLNESVYMGIDFLWLIPAADLAYFVSLGLVLYLLNRYWPRVFSVQLATFVSALLAFSVLLFVTQRIQTIPALLLAAGLAVQLTRMMAAHPRMFRNIVHYTLAWPAIFSRPIHPREAAQENLGFDPKRRELLAGSAVVLAGLTLGVQGRQLLGELTTLQKEPPSKPGAPNILLIVLDTTRANSLNAYGYGRPTSPQLALLAQRGVLFKSALSTASWTLPSHASMFTGRYAHELSAERFKPLDATYPTLAEVLSAHGYATAGFAANNLYCTTEQGINRGFTHYEDFAVSAGQAFVDSEVGRLAVDNYGLRSAISYYDVPNRKRAQDVNDNFLHWLGRNGSRPFFAFLNYFDAHEPYLPPASFAGQFGSASRTDLIGDFSTKIGPIDRPGKWQLKPEEIEAARDAYDAAIGYMDDQIGKLLGELDKRGQLQNTLVVVTADHGEHFGEHGLYIHGNSLYLPLLHVPMIMALPGRVPAAKQVSEHVSLRDLPATILDVLGLSAKGLLPGNSYARYWSYGGATYGSAPSPLLSEVSAFKFRYMPDHWPVGSGSMKSLVVDRYHYIRNNGSGREELYDIVNDPLEQQDLATSSGAERIVNDYRAMLQAAAAKGPDTQAGSSGSAGLSGSAG